MRKAKERIMILDQAAEISQDRDAISSFFREKNIRSREKKERSGYVKAKKRLRV
jgi:hypothetical protein